jgi:FKBP-type peptidyl-prolyl cis-trans isomerase FklB
MNRKLVLVVAFGLVAAQLWTHGRALWAQDKAPKKIELKSNQDKASYAVGASTAKSIRHQFETQGLPIDVETLLRGFRDGLGDGKLALTDAEMQAAFEAIEEEVSKRNADEGETFLAANKKKKDVVTLADGLQYKVIKKGTGKAPTARDVVTVNYRGKLLSGKEFDSSYARKEPLTIPVASTIHGWVEALPLMTVGSKWELYVPSDLAYGPTGNDSIPPNATLVFEVELLDVAKPGSQPPVRGKSEAAEDLKPPTGK